MGCGSRVVPHGDYRIASVRKLLHAFLLLIALLLSLTAVADNLGNAFSDAESFGNSKNADLFFNIKDQTASDKVPYYGTVPSETNLYHGGHGDAQLSQSGTDKVTNCAGYTSSGNAVRDQECDAVNFVAGHPQAMQHVPIAPTDSIFQNSETAKSNAQNVFSSSGITTSTDGQCVVETNTIPAVKTQRICTSIKEIDVLECLAPRNIVYAQTVDPASGKIIFTVVSSDYDMSACSNLVGDLTVEHLGSECESAIPLSPLPEGISPAAVAPDGCFVRRHSYAGLTGVEDNSECESYDSDAACTFQGYGECQQSFNLGANAQPVCTEQEKKYLCTTSQSVKQTTLNCAGQKFCVNGNCFSTSNEPDKDLTQSVSAMETIRQAGVYLNEETLRIFDGDEGKCRVKLSGVVNCCKSSSGGGAYNNNLLFNLTVQAGKNVLSYGSKYLYDALYASNLPTWMMKGISAIYGVDPTKIPAGGLLGAWSPSLSYFGFTVSMGKIAPGFVSNLIGISSIPQMPLGFGTNITIGFDPSSLAISLAIMVIQELMSCDPDEKILAMKKGENLCTQVGSYCSKKVLGVCLVRKRAFCCYNSRLGRIINEQGRAQIGKGWGSPKNPDCSGFTVGEFNSINFAALDLSGFSREIMDAVKYPNVPDLRDNAQAVINRRVNSYYETGSQMGK